MSTYAATKETYYGAGAPTTAQKAEPPKMIDLRADDHFRWFRYIEYIGRHIPEDGEEWQYMRDEVKPLGKQACDSWTNFRFNTGDISICKMEFEKFKLKLIRQKKYEKMYDELLAARGDKEPIIEELRAFVTDQKMSSAMMPVSEATNDWSSICTCCGTLPLSSYNAHKSLFSGGIRDEYRRRIYFQFAQPGKQQDLKDTHPEELVIEAKDGLFILNWVDE